MYRGRGNKVAVGGVKGELDGRNAGGLRGLEDGGEISVEPISVSM